MGTGNSHGYGGFLQLIQALRALQSEEAGKRAGKIQYAETHLRHITYMITTLLIMIEILNPIIGLSLC